MISNKITQLQKNKLKISDWQNMPQTKQKTFQDLMALF